MDGIENKLIQGRFNWKRDSYEIAMYYPEHFDADKYNWEKHSWAVAQYCPQHFDADRYNWKDYSWYIPRHCPQHFDPERYDFTDASAIYELRKYAPHLLLKCLNIHN